MPRTRFVAPAESQFRSVLNERVDAYFRDHGLSKHANWRMWLKTAFYVGGYLGAYFGLILRGDTASYFAGMTIMGFMTALIGFNVAHDASHRGYSGNKWVNELWSHSFTLTGAHPYTWKIVHNVIHHTYTNIPEADGDLRPVAALRYTDTLTPWRAYHRFQHIYAFALYSLASLVWVVSKDYVHMRKKEHCGYPKPTPPWYEWVLLFNGKLLHYTALLIVPMALLGMPVWQAVLGFLMMHGLAGVSLACVFAVGHLVDEVAIVPADSEGCVHDDWAAHQLKTTANFSTDSAFFFWTVGGLNFQIEHHLFPTVCHVHYPAIAPIVQRTAAEFGLPYVSYPSFGHAVAAHVRFLRRYGQAPAESGRRPLLELRVDRRPPSGRCSPGGGGASR
jgi:linoleoyl-CoA desaturase